MNTTDLSGKKGLVLGIANEHSIAYGCAQSLVAQGAEVAVTYLNEKARHYVEPLAEQLGASFSLPCDISNDEQVDRIFAQIDQQWGGLDFLLHSIAFAPLEDLRGRLVDSSREGFLHAMDISCHSLMRLARRAEPLMTNGGTIFTMSYLGSEKVVENYNLMGPVKAALESAVRYLAFELGIKGIRVHAISPGPIMTRAASGLTEFNDMLQKASQQSPLKKPLKIEDVGALVAFLASDAAALITGDTIYIDGGYHVID